MFIFVRLWQDGHRLKIPAPIRFFKGAFVGCVQHQDPVFFIASPTPDRTQCIQLRFGGSRTVGTTRTAPSYFTPDRRPSFSSTNEYICQSTSPVVNRETGARILRTPVARILMRHCETQAPVKYRSYFHCPASRYVVALCLIKYSCAPSESQRHRPAAPNFDADQPSLVPAAGREFYSIELPRKLHPASLPRRTAFRMPTYFHPAHAPRFLQFTTDNRAGVYLLANFCRAIFCPCILCCRTMTLAARASMRRAPPASTC